MTVITNKHRPVIHPDQRLEAGGRGAEVTFTLHMLLPALNCTR